jgi:hypothetical protein
VAEGLSLADIRKFMQRERAKPPHGPVNCVVMNSLWYERIREAFSPPMHPKYGPYELGDKVVGLDIYLDETYPEPVFMNRADYMRERASRGG